MKTRHKKLWQTSLAVGFAYRVIVFVLLLLLTFALPRLMPGDPLALLLSSDVARALTPAEAENLRQQMGLSGSWVQQLMDYFLSVVGGDFGYSLRHAMPVFDLLAEAIPWTLLLLFVALPIYLFGGVFLGIVAGQAPHSGVDRMITGFMTVLGSIPPFVTAIFVLVVFGVYWQILPVSGAEPLFPSQQPFVRALGIAQHAALPALALALHEILRFYYMSRGEAIGLSARPFVINARARGIYGWRLKLNYYGRNMLPMILARLSDSIAALISGVLYVEIIFSYPGVGQLIYGAILERDYVLLQGAVLGLALFVLLLNWLIDSAITVLVQRG